VKSGRRTVTFRSRAATLSCLSIKASRRLIPEGRSTAMFANYLKRLLVLGVVLGSLAAVASASAATVTVSPGGAVTGTSGSAQLTFNTAARTLNCTQMAFTATLASTSGSYPLAISNNLQFFCSGNMTVVCCVSVTFVCGAARWNITGATVSGVTPGRIVGINCTVTVSTTRCSVRISGSVPVSFDNATSQLTIGLAGQSLAATGSTDGASGTCSALPNDTSVSFTDSTGRALVFAVTPRTAIVAT
jgi:hypothetical protein